VAIVGTPRKLQKKFAFVVEIEGVVSANFTKCSELSAEIAKVEQWEGGSLIPDKSPGRVTVSDVTLERGVANGDSDLYTWWQDVVRVSANSGLPSPFYKRVVDVVSLERDGSVLRRWILSGAWPTKFVAGEWDNDADENVIEMVTLAIDTFDLVPVGE
jgi:phage tail-like protein